jgi:uncharacterized protein YjdB
MPSLRIAVLAPLLLALGSCGLLPTVCTLEFGVEVRPTQRTVPVGGEFTATATAVTCGGRDRSPYQAVWVSTNAAVAEVNAQTGRVRGVAPGTARIRALDHPDSEWAWGEVVVTVTP